MINLHNTELIVFFSLDNQSKKTVVIQPKLYYYLKQILTWIHLVILQRLLSKNTNECTKTVKGHFVMWNLYLVFPYSIHITNIKLPVCYVKCAVFAKTGTDYLLVVDISQDASEDLQQEDTQQQDKVLWAQGTTGLKIWCRSILNITLG